MSKRILCLFLIFVVMMTTISSISAFASNADDFDWYYENGCAIISGYYGTSSNVVIPSKVGTSNIPVTEIGSWAFEDNTTIKSVTLPDTMTTIGDYAFWGCKNLTHITVPDSVTKVGMSAFYETNLQNLPEDNSFKYIGKVAYSYKGDFNYADIVFPEGTLGIASGMFYVSRYAGPKSVVIPDSVKVIGDWAFKNCSVLESVIIGSGVEYIGDDAFDTYSDVTLYCYEGSNALGYARLNGFNYEVIEKPTEPIDKYIVGDSNDDGAVDIFDATHIQMYIASLLSKDKVHLSASDIDQDGVVSIIDATSVQLYLASLKVDYPIGDVVEVYPTVTENRVYFDGFSLVLPDDFTYVQTGDIVRLCEKYNYQTGWDGTLVYITMCDEKPTEDEMNWLDRVYLGEHKGVYYLWHRPTSVEYNYMDTVAVEKYLTAKNKVDSTMNTFRFE